MRRRNYLALVLVACMSMLFLGVLFPSSVIKTAGHHVDRRRIQTAETTPRTGLVHGNFSLTVTNDEIDAFRVTLPPTLTGFKNPCWIEEVSETWNPSKRLYPCPLFKPRVGEVTIPTKKAFSAMTKVMRERYHKGERWRMRCFPYFFLLGFTKSGTTEIYRVLKKYATDFASPAAKEPQYWDRRRATLQNETCDGKILPLFARYTDVFDAAAEKIRTTPTLGSYGEEVYTSVTGDFSPSTISLDLGWTSRSANTGLPGPAHTTANYIHNLNPKTKFMIIMRDPVERFYSNHRMTQRLNKAGSMKSAVLASPLEAANTSVIKMQQCELKTGTHGCAYTNDGTMFQYLTRGLYHVYIKDWLTVFPREQFLILSNEDFKVNRLDNIQRIFSFLDLEPLSPSQIAAVEKEQEEVRLTPPSSHPRMGKEAEAILREFYRPHIKELVTLLGDELFDWTKTWA